MNKTMINAPYPNRVNLNLIVAPKRVFLLTTYTRNEYFLNSGERHRKQMINNSI